MIDLYCRYIAGIIWCDITVIFVIRRKSIQSANARRLSRCKKPWCHFRMTGKAISDWGTPIFQHWIFTLPRSGERWCSSATIKVLVSQVRQLWNWTTICIMINNNFGHHGMGQATQTSPNLADDGRWKSQEVDSVKLFGIGQVWDSRWNDPQPLVRFSKRWNLIAK